MNAQTTLAPALGWFSIALGATQIVAPKQLSRAIGTRDHSMLMRALGAREIGAGVAVLSKRKPAAGLWARVAGDVMDVGMVIAALQDERNDRARLQVTLASLLAIGAADIIAALSPSVHTEADAVDKPLFTKVVSMMIEPGELAAVLSDEQTLRRLVPGYESATLRLQQAPSSNVLEWHVGAVPLFHGTLRMTIGQSDPERGTTLRVDAYRSGMNVPGMLRKLTGEGPGDALAIGLHRLKNIVEVGEIVTAESPSGRMKVGA